MSFWKILRVLTTDKCNYNCIYCHNEGQLGKNVYKDMKLNEFIDVMNNLQNSGIEEIRFSGGEPLVNKQTIDMIEWANNNTEYEIGLATNGSLLTDNIALRLSKTRVLITLHFPGADKSSYKNVTGMEFSNFEKCVELLDKYGISYSFNSVLYPKIINNLEAILDYSKLKQKRIKLLPYIDKESTNLSSSIISKLNDSFDKEYEKVFDNQSGITKWSNNSGFAVKLIESPCYKKNIEKCKYYGEIRFMSGLRFQPCIFSKYETVDSSNNVYKKLLELWENFSKCYGYEN